MTALRVLSLFAGIGGFDLGLERTGGFKTVAVAEVDPYASKVLALRFPDAPNVGDVATAEYPDADVICAGFPCQDLSYAGTGAGLAGSRSGLFWEVVRAARVVRPRYIVLENVAALLGRGLDVVLRALAEIGYDAEWHCIPASAVGAPHRRDRIWIVAHARGDEHEGDRAPISGALAAELSSAHPNGETDGFKHFHAPQRDDHPRTHSHLADAPFVFGDGGDDHSGSCSEGPRQVSQSRDGDSHYRTECGWWTIEPDVGRVAHGIPKRVDRLRCLGNAVVPQIPELIGRAILASLEHPARPSVTQSKAQDTGSRTERALQGRIARPAALSFDQHADSTSAGRAHDHV